MPDSRLCGRSASVLKGMISVLLSVGRRGNGVDHRLGDHVGHPVAAIGLSVEAVQVLGNIDASTIQQELSQEVALCSWGGITVSYPKLAFWKHWKTNDLNSDSWVLLNYRDFRGCSSTHCYITEILQMYSVLNLDKKTVPKAISVWTYIYIMESICAKSFYLNKKIQWISFTAGTFMYNA